MGRKFDRGKKASKGSVGKTEDLPGHVSMPEEFAWMNADEYRATQEAQAELDQKNSAKTPKPTSLHQSESAYPREIPWKLTTMASNRVPTRSSFTDDGDGGSLRAPAREPSQYAKSSGTATATKRTQQGIDKEIKERAKSSSLDKLEGSRYRTDVVAGRTKTSYGKYPGIAKTKRVQQPDVVDSNADEFMSTKMSSSSKSKDDTVVLGQFSAYDGNNPQISRPGAERIPGMASQRGQETLAHDQVAQLRGQLDNPRVTQPGAERIPGMTSQSNQENLVHDQVAQPVTSSTLVQNYDVEHLVPEAEIVEIPPLATAVKADDRWSPRKRRWVIAGVLLSLAGLTAGLVVALTGGNDSGNDSASSGFTGTLQMLAPGGENHYKDFLTDRFRSRVEIFKERTGIDVQINPVGDIDDLYAELLADVEAEVYDGYIFLPFATATLVEENGLADLTEFVRDSEDVDWLDVLRYNREIQAVYDNAVRLLPCDGDIHSLFYRKDLFQLYNVQVPRTWDEYDEAAAFFHGLSIPKDDGSGENVALVGSCVGRRPACHEDYFFSVLVHSSLTQTEGTTHGALFDPTNFDPLLGEAMAETLRHLENHIKFGAEDEFTSEDCGGLNIRLMNEGRCAMTYMWGDSFARHLMEGSVVGGKLGVAATPGSTKVLDRSSGKLVNCTEEICPFGETFEDIGRVNRAPYAAAGGWSTGVSGSVSPVRRKAMADFFGFVCGKEESIKDVIVNASGSLITGADPYRSSHLNETKWVEQGYPRDATIEYLTTVKTSYESENVVLDLRVNKALEFQTDMQGEIFLHLSESLSVSKTHFDRMAVASNIEAMWRDTTEKFNALHNNTGRTLLTIYRRSLNLPV